MEKIALVADSASDLTKEQIEKYNVTVLPLKIIYKNNEYLDGIDITPEEVYERLEEEIPSTSLPSPQDIENVFTKLENEGYTHVIAIPLSSNLSGTYNTVKLIADNHPKLTSTIFDSKSLTLGTGSLVLACGEMLQQGKSYKEIVEQLPLMRDNVTVYYVVDTLKYLIKGGRIGKVSGTIGSLLNLKPIISIDKDGVYYTYAKIRGKKQATSKLISIAEESLKKGKAKIWIMHGGCLDEGKAILEKFKNMPNITSLEFGCISPALGVHTGKGLIGLIIANEPFHN
ncbi:DegV family protein [Clostridium grantii]|uniref:EDD domain protein, DegV family n=1 Tax=Clostridium grantii DSM 8605 TaxID=1121316 RepID=A0A1M5UNQ8_9CLOT|nr:DegV family protein [Clostridium grantii]SHH64692.1 EDD domain protein, DegV family [Clostridium grantii DSM 8605]